jgi:beta-aspartyl-peptidase (threonine type)
MRPTLMLHGGAGAMKSMDSSRERTYRAALREAAAAGARILEVGGRAVDAVVAVNVVMEDSGVFNAGLGSGLTADGRIEMDAGVMDGEHLDFGSVAAVEGIANPVTLARHVMDDTPHCMIVGPGAQAFAHTLGLPLRGDFPSAARAAEWERRKGLMKTTGGSLTDQLAALGGVLGDASSDPHSDGPVGQADTVGAVAMDSDGHVATAITTGGIWMKMPGRVGDSPMIGAGLWAVDGQGVACATGTGETILRVLLCREVVDQMRAGRDATAACAAAIGLLERHFGSNNAGVIALGPDGEPGYAFHTRGMGRSLWLGGMTDPACGIWPGEDWDRAVPG